MIMLIYLFLIAGLALILWGVRGSFEYRVIGVKLEATPEQLKRIQMRSWLSRPLPFTQRLLERSGLGQAMKSSLEAAHVKLAAQEFFNLKILSMFFFGATAFFTLRKFGPLTVLVGFVFGYLILDLWLRRKIKQRKHDIVHVLPETVDLLGLCVEAGLDFTTAIRWVIDKVQVNPLMEELPILLEEIKWGKPRTQALKDMSKRLVIPEVSSFVQTLVQAERMGTPVAEAFMILSEDSRMQRFHRGERFAMQAPIKILIPLIFCILPVIGIVVGAPILLQFMQNKLF